MEIGLLCDGNGKYPNLALMKISAYHKRRGDNVEFAESAMFKHYDIVYVSRTFNLDFIKKNLTDYISADKFILGGSGYAISVVDGKEVYDKTSDPDLSDEIEHIYPDYSLYPELTKDTAYGFLTRGCPNNCGFCIVSKKEGRISHKVADLSEWWDGQKNIKLMDANILACKDRENLLKQLIDSEAKIDYTQGLDARFITDDIAEMICQTKIKRVHFAFDLMENHTAIVRGLTIFKRHSSLSDRDMVVYILTNYNTTFEQDIDRIRLVMQLGYVPDVRIYQKQNAPKFLKYLQRWANNRAIYQTCELWDYVPRADGKTLMQIYKEGL